MYHIELGIYLSSSDYPASTLKLNVSVYLGCRFISPGSAYKTSYTPINESPYKEHKEKPEGIHYYLSSFPK